MKKLCFWILIISVVVLLTLFLTGCDGDKTSEDDSSAASADSVSDSETWLDMSKAEKCEDDYFSEVIITQIDDDCFYGKPTDCVGIVSLLCSEEGRYITGQSIYVDGGKSIK